MQPSHARTPPRPPASGDERDILLTLFDLGRQVASVIDLDELLQRIPELIGRLIPFDAFGVYLVDERRRRAEASAMPSAIRRRRRAAS